MLVMPILINETKNSEAMIYNVEVKLNKAAKVKKSTSLKGYKESDIIVNGSSYNNSPYNNINKNYNSVVNFIRNNIKADKKQFLIATRTYSNSPLFDLYSVAAPPSKISTGLDNLYGSAIIDMQKEIPDIKHGRDIDLKDLGVDLHITEEKVEKMSYIIKNVKDRTKWDYLFTANGVRDLKTTLDFMNLFDFSIIDNSGIEKNQLESIINSFSHTHDQNFKLMKKYYAKAINNKDVFSKLNRLSQLIYNKPIHLIHRKKDKKVLIMKKKDA